LLSVEIPPPVAPNPAISFASLFSIPRKMAGNGPPKQKPQAHKLDLEQLGKSGEFDFLEDRKELPEDLLLEWLSAFDFSVLNPFDQDVVLLQTNSLLGLARRQAKSPWRKDTKKKTSGRVVIIQNCVAVDELKFLKARD
jgi:hypothetical protein